MHKSCLLRVATRFLPTCTSPGTRYPAICAAQSKGGAPSIPIWRATPNCRRSPWRPDLSAEQIEQVKPVLHPVVRTHPETGRKALFVSEHFTTRIVGLPEDESRALLDELFAHSVRPEHLYRHVWRERDLLFWDNRSLMHLAAGTPDHLRRKLHRTTIEGDSPF